ncbi:hypothetical protein [Paenibacillus sp. MER TA 81-3]|nr:hypothetical protein [Paenibacillus sp. MER TA 81-3]
MSTVILLLRQCGSITVRSYVLRLRQVGIVGTDLTQGENDWNAFN